MMASVFLLKLPLLIQLILHSAALGINLEKQLQVWKGNPSCTDQPNQININVYKGFFVQHRCNISQPTVLTQFTTLRLTLMTGEFSKLSRQIERYSSSSPSILLMKSENRADYSLLYVATLHEPKIPWHFNFWHKRDVGTQAICCCQTYLTCKRSHSRNFLFTPDHQ
ncbi:hypothetical protein K2173_008317 [Erythroxylum novogranatense]|uniref:Uncharacterized protein n=1 Tax=Erythroxylum novogranatense TaxID=1862640 RepID=A0AAV8U6M3_9ROSI|nr:hypothetical protein K2173_008317 [Erythroxylum novogranatense]